MAIGVGHADLRFFAGWTFRWRPPATGFSYANDANDCSESFREQRKLLAPRDVMFCEQPRDASRSWRVCRSTKTHPGRAARGALILHGAIRKQFALFAYKCFAAPECHRSAQGATREQIPRFARDDRAHGTIGSIRWKFIETNSALSAARSLAIQRSNSCETSPNSRSSAAARSTCVADGRPS